MENHIAVVINNNQEGWKNIIETEPNVTLDIGTKLYLHPVSPTWPEKVREGYLPYTIGAMQVEVGRQLMQGKHMIHLKWKSALANPFEKLVEVGEEKQEAPNFDMPLGEMFGLKLYLSNKVPEGEVHLCHGEDNAVLAKFDVNYDKENE